MFISAQPEFIDMLHLLEQNWAAIGIDIHVNATDGTLLRTGFILPRRSTPIVCLREVASPKLTGSKPPPSRRS